SPKPLVFMHFIRSVLGEKSAGLQDHTVLPYAITPLALRGSIAHSPRQSLSRPATSRARNAIASTATRTPRIVTTRTPLFDEAGWRVKEADLRKMKSRIFSMRNLDGPNHVESADEIRFCARRGLAGVLEARP